MTCNLKKGKYMSIEIDEIIRSKRKTIALVVTADSRLIVRAPLRHAADYIKAWLRKKKVVPRKSRTAAARNEAH